MAKMIVTAPSGNTVNMRQSPDSTALIVAKVPVRAVVEAEASQ
jgi:SH3-like domain-containing protein